ncbi:hypothetical protein E2C01_035261 [Portunus trituberculatus]|uniref:Uncharacterized protein n=1 Tax=Portunus trituberculatus TaxID=210409 RepID=A0A5B7F3R7_PORTR|nr:hypothetical protein [Portunus trituberculatus]
MLLTDHDEDKDRGRRGVGRLAGVVPGVGVGHRGHSQDTAGVTPGSVSERRDKSVGTNFIFSQGTVILREWRAAGHCKQGRGRRTCGVQ